MDVHDLLRAAREERAKRLAGAHQTPDAFRMHPYDIEHLKSYADTFGQSEGWRWPSTDLLYGVPLFPDERVPCGCVQTGRPDTV